MSFLDTVRRAKTYLEEQGRVSLRALKREFNLDDDTLDELIDELVEIQRVAVRDGRALARAGGLTPAPTEPPEPERAPRDYTPKHLADKILQSKSAIEGERKQVTVLFADVQHSTELSEALDPEAWHRILERFFQVLADGVHRFEGTVNQYTGDGIMALFGAPIAHEDHAQRACYTALHLRDELRRYTDELRVSQGLNFTVRMGLNSGEVVVGKIGDDLRMDYTAQGHTVGLAAHIEQLAAPNAVYLSECTADLVSGYFEMRDLGPSNLKGSSGPARVFELERVGAMRTRFEVSRARGLTRFVGREKEVRELEAALERARAGNGQVVGLVAEAGIGKSRLCYEFLQRCRSLGLTVLEGAGVAHGKNIPLLPLLQILRQYYGITEQDSDRTAREKIAGKLLLIDAGFRDTLPLVFELMGVPDPERPAPQMDPEARQRQLFAALRRLVQSSAEQNPVVALLEDLHWIDAGTEAYLEQWVDATAGAQGLLLVNFRPEYRAKWTNKSYYHQLPLLPLGPEAIRELLDDLLGSDPSIAGLAEAIHARTAGNPFFAEEIVRSLIESRHLEGAEGHYRLTTPVDKLEVPSTVQSLLAARIDRLPEREKQVIQTAAVVGHEFTEPILEAVAGLASGEISESLAALKSAEFIHEQALYPVAEYAFRHPLTRDVAYGSQLGERRAAVHAAIARTIVELDADDLEAQAALLAHHWENAGEPLEAARCHARAAERGAASDLAQARRHWDRVRALVPEIPESRERLGLGVMACGQLLTLSVRFGAPDSEKAELFEEGLAFAERLDTPRLTQMLHIGYAVARGSGEPEVYVRHGREALRIAEASGELEQLLLGWMGLATGLLFYGDVREALEVASRALENPPPQIDLGLVTGLPPYIYLIMLRGLLLADAGRMEEGAREVERGLEMAKQQGSLETILIGNGFRASVAHASGDWERELRYAREALDLSEKSGTPFSLLSSFRFLGRAYLSRSEWKEAGGFLERALSIMRERRILLANEGQVLADLAVAQLGMKEGAEALASAQQAISRSRELKSPGTESSGQLALATVLLGTRGRDAQQEIEAALTRAAELIESTGAHGYAALVHEKRAELALTLGDEALRERELGEALRLHTEMGATGHAERLARERIS
jgi:class 3 adenylate cyclase/tetratricopeptide (TPR) repeat protein